MDDKSKIYRAEELSGVVGFVSAEVESIGKKQVRIKGRPLAFRCQVFVGVNEADFTLDAALDRLRDTLRGEREALVGRMVEIEHALVGLEDVRARRCGTVQEET